MGERASVPPLTISGWLRWSVVEHLLPGNARTVLDIGAGAGSIGSLLSERYEYVGIEPDPLSFEIAEGRIGDRGRVLNCRFEDFAAGQYFDVVCAFEVLEHLEDDEAALGRWIQHLRPGGWLLLSVPKDRLRYAAVNARAGDLRRYDPDGLRLLMSRAGLHEIVMCPYGSPYGNLQEWIQNLVLRARRPRTTMPERTAASGRFLLPPTWAKRSVHLLAVPLRYTQRPFAHRGIGTGLVARGRLDG